MSKYISKEELLEKAHGKLLNRLYYEKNHRPFGTSAYPRLRPYIDYPIEAFDLENRENWPVDVKKEFLRCKAALYSEYRNLYQKVKKARAADLWTKTFNTGVLNKFLIKYGFKIVDNQVCAIDCGRPLIEWVLDTYVIPNLEKELGIKGVKRIKRATANSRNVLDWSKAEVVSKK